MSTIFFFQVFAPGNGERIKREAGDAANAAIPAQPPLL